MPTAQTPLLVFFNILIIVLIYNTLKSVRYYPYAVLSSKYNFASLLCLIFCLFSFWGTDWFHYLELFPGLQLGWKGHMEEVYVWIAQNLSPNYIVFRLVIWGSAFFLFLKTIDQLSISKYLTLYFFGTIYIIWFSYARVSLVMAMVFWGFALIHTSTKLYMKLLALLVIGSSYFFHKTALFAIGTAFIATAILKYPKIALRMMLISFPLIIVIAKAFVASFVVMDIDASEGEMSSYMAKGQNYMDKSSAEVGIGALIRSFFETSPYYGIAYLSYKCLSSKQAFFVPNDIKAFMLLQIVIVFIASIFAFDFSVNTSALYGRFLRFAPIPNTIVLAYLYQSQFKRQLTKLVILIATCGTGYTLLYTLYCSIVN